MPENRVRRIGLFLLVFILLLFILKQSFYLRGIGYDQVPDTFVILDERTNVWHGLSIRETGVPAAWSNIGFYKLGTGGDVKQLNLVANEYDSPNLLQFRNYPKPIFVLHPLDLGEKKGIKHLGFVQPYLDHPPFGAIVLSSFVTGEVKTFSDLTPHDFRKASLWMGVATGILIFFLGWQVFKNPWIGLLGASIYGTVPTFNLLSRYGLLENVLTPLMLLTINLLVISQKEIPKSYSKLVNLKTLLILAGVISGLAALTKIIGWFVLIIGIILLRYWKVKLKDSLYFIVPSVVVGLLYFAWGLYLAPSVFIDLFRYQGLERGFIGSINFLVSATGVGILNFPIDGWWIGGFLVLILMPFKKEHIPIFIGAGVVIFTALFLGGANYPWYFIPLIPFMCLAIASFFWQIAVSPKFISILVFFLVFVSSTFYWGYGVYQASLESTNFQQPYGVYRILLIFFVLAALILFIPPFKKIKHLWFIFIIVLIVALVRFNERSMYFILSNWGKLPSPFTPGTF